MRAACREEEEEDAAARVAAPSPVRCAVSLSLLRDFADGQRGTHHTFAAVDFVSEADGGGGSLTVDEDGLEAHLDKRLRAERAMRTRPPRPSGLRLTLATLRTSAPAPPRPS